MATAAEVCSLLGSGEVEVLGRLAGSSNGALLVSVRSAEREAQAVYKPVVHERPLRDFPSATLARREVAAAVLDEAIGWQLVPVTVWRESGPLGPGMVQEFVRGQAPNVVEVFRDDVPSTWRAVLSAFDENDRKVVVAHADNQTLRRIALFDAVINNADRKAGHLLGPHSDKQPLSAVDHGLTFHVEPKLRTVLWGFAGEPISNEDIERLAGAAANGELWESLATLVAIDEVEAAQRRLNDLLESGSFPSLPTDRYPVPWPIF